MFVSDCMTRDPVTVEVTHPLEEARGILLGRRFRHLPVLENGALVGILTQGDLMVALHHLLVESPDREAFEKAMQETRVEQYMTRTPVVIEPDETIETAALAMREYKIGALPVVQEGELVGILTETDLFDLLIDALGLRQGGARMVFDLEPGRENATVEEVLGRLRREELRITSLVTYHPRQTGAAGEPVKIVVRARGKDSTAPPPPRPRVGARSTEEAAG